MDTNEYSDRLSKIIKAYKDNFWTLTMLSEATELGYKTVHDVIRGKRKAHGSTLLVMEQALGIAKKK